MNTTSRRKIATSRLKPQFKNGKRKKNLLKERVWYPTQKVKYMP